MRKKNIMVDGEAFTEKKFAKPSREFGILPFWFWNGELSHDEIKYQLQEFKDKGLPGVYIHARFGVREELGYMNEEWLERCRFTLQTAHEMGLQTWIYDEYNWPSGTCGQTIMKDHPELTNVYLELCATDLPGQYFMFMEGTDSRYNDLEQSEPIYACATKLEDMEKGKYDVVDLMPSLSFDKVITWEAPKGPWKLFYFIERKSTWYSDVLNPETTKTFLEYTHEKYKKYFGKEDFGRVQGFFTDEPAMHYFETARNNFIIPWSKHMLEIFRERNGYDLKKNLPKLFFDYGGDTEQVRYDFWSTLSEQYNKAYFGQIHDWCKKNDVVFTGHLLYEESLRLHSRIDGNLFDHLKQFDMTGVDHLYPRIGTRDMENEHVALKIASSAAHQNGSARLCCESMGGSYWDCTMERMKWIGDWEYMLGVNQFIPHGFHYSVEGERKRDWPPSMSYQFSWWEYYGLFNDYMSRLGYALSGGDHVAKIAILYPMNSVWANYVPEEATKICACIDNDFATLTDRLLRLHVDFDYIDEKVLNNECEIRDGKICIKGEKYEMLLLPPVTHITCATVDTLEKLVSAGVRLGGEALLPYKTVDGECNVTERMKKIFGRNPAEVREKFLRTTDTKQSFVSDGKVAFVDGIGFAANKDEKAKMAVLDGFIRSLITPEVEIDSDEVFYQHRIRDGKDLFFVINPTGDARDVTIAWNKTACPEEWNLETGVVKPVLVYTHKDGKTSLKWHFEPYGSVLFNLSSETDKAHAEASDIVLESVTGKKITGYGRLAKAGSVRVVSENEVKTVKVPKSKNLPVIDLNGNFTVSINKPNSLNTDAWKMTYAAPKDNVKAITTGKADMSGWLSMTMGAWELQLPTERKDNTYPVDLWYVTSVEADFVPSDLRIMIDGFKGSRYELYVNGKQITATPVRSYLDAEMKEVPVSAEFRKGTNTVAVKLTVTSKSDGMIDLLKVIGTFGIENRGGKDVIVPFATTMSTGNWVEGQLPYYSGTVEYTKTFTVSKEAASSRLILSCDIGRDVLNVKVNGKQVKTCLWKPYAADITDFVKEGENTVTLGVVNTLMNLLESSRTPSGLFDAKIIPFDKYEIDC